MNFDPSPSPLRYNFLCTLALTSDLLKLYQLTLISEDGVGVWSNLCQRSQHRHQYLVIHTLLFGQKMLKLLVNSDQNLLGRSERL